MQLWSQYHHHHPLSRSRAVISAYFFLFEMPYVSKKRINNSLFAPVCRLCIRERREREKPWRAVSQPAHEVGWMRICAEIHPTRRRRLFFLTNGFKRSTCCLIRFRPPPPLCAAPREMPNAHRCFLSLSRAPTAPTPLNYSTRSLKLADLKEKSPLPRHGRRALGGMKSLSVNVCVTCWQDNANSW